MARPCRTCTHPRRADIDAALVRGDSFESVSERYGIGSSSLFRHKSEHLVKVSPKAIAAVAERLRKDSGTVPEHVSVLEITRAERLVDQLGALGKRTESLLAQVEAGTPFPAGEGEEPIMVVDFKAAAALIRELRGCLELQAKMLGELQAGANAQIHTHPAWIDLRDSIVSEFASEPDVLERFVRVVRESAERRQKAA